MRFVDEPRLFTICRLTCKHVASDRKKCCIFFSCSAQKDLHFEELEIIDIQNHEVHFDYFNFSVDQPCMSCNSIFKKPSFAKVEIEGGNKNKNKRLSGK